MAFQEINRSKTRTFGNRSTYSSPDHVYPYHLVHVVCYPTYNSTNSLNHAKDTICFVYARGEQVEALRRVYTFIADWTSLSLVRVVSEDSFQPTNC